jgi:Flp pilus assembly protein TadG
MLEAAIVMPVAISLMIGGIEFGNLFLRYGTAAKSARDAARYLARVPLAKLCDTGPTGVQTIATNLAVYGNASGTGDPLIPPPNPGPPPSGSTINLTVDCGNPVNVTVQAVVPNTPLMFGGFASISFLRNATYTHTQPYTWTP